MICAELPVFAPAFAEAPSRVRGESAGTPVEMCPLAPSPTPLCVPVPCARAAPMAKMLPTTRADRAREEAMVLLMSSPRKIPSAALTPRDTILFGPKGRAMTVRHVQVRTGS